MLVVVVVVVMLRLWSRDRCLRVELHQCSTIGDYLRLVHARRGFGACCTGSDREREEEEDDDDNCRLNLIRLVYRFSNEGNKKKKKKNKTLIGIRSYRGDCRLRKEWRMRTENKNSY